VILLGYAEDLSQAEIAERLEWPLGTVKSRTRRAMAQLRARLGPVAELTEPSSAPAQARAGSAER
jgi:RNA polymerase sigma-70 factor (ECF subfamily)